MLFCFRMRRVLPLLALLALPLAGCSQNVATGRHQLLLFSDDQVNAMGEEAKGSMIAEFGGEVRSEELRTYVNGVGQRLLRQVEDEYKDLAWEFIVLDSSVVNAFALPGGKVFITRGIMNQFDSEAEVAGVLGHEIGHVTARHVDERLTNTAVAQFGTEVLGAMSDYQLVRDLAPMAAQTALLHFSREQELESDKLGMRYMAEAGYDPAGMLDVIDVLLAAMGTDRQPEFLSTHPHPETRAEQGRELLKTTYAQTRNNPAYQKYQGRFRRQAEPELR